MATDEKNPRVCWEGRHLRVVTRGGWEFVQRPGVTGIVGIVAVTDEGRLVLTEQYRPPVNRRVIELPAGLVGDVAGQQDESLLAAARRELMEETGYEAAGLERLCHGTASAGISNEEITLFLATGLRKVGQGGGDPGEDITVHEAPVAALLPWLRRREAAGILVDLKVYAALPFCGTRAFRDRE
jgi:ADP-ribose pyrophosphatase